MCFNFYWGVIMVIYVIFTKLNSSLFDLGCLPHVSNKTTPSPNELIPCLPVVCALFVSKIIKYGLMMKLESSLFI